MGAVAVGSSYRRAEDLQILDEFITKISIICPELTLRSSYAHPIYPLIKSGVVNQIKTLTISLRIFYPRLEVKHAYQASEEQRRVY